MGNLLLECFERFTNGSKALKEGIDTTTKASSLLIG